MEYSPEAVKAPRASRLTYTKPTPEPVLGCRLIDLNMFMQGIRRQLVYKLCRQVGTLTIRPEDEISRGIAGDIGFFCTTCRRLSFSVRTSAFREEKDNEVQEVNLRCVLGAVATGLGEKTSSRFCAILGVPTLENRASAFGALFTPVLRHKVHTAEGTCALCVPRLF